MDIGDKQRLLVAHLRAQGVGVDADPGVLCEQTSRDQGFGVDKWRDADRACIQRLAMAEACRVRDRERAW